MEGSVEGPRRAGAVRSDSNPDTIVPMIRYILPALALLASIAWTVGRPDEVPFRKHEIDLGANEPCAFADINGDGKLDIVSGENWYEAPR